MEKIFLKTFICIQCSKKFDKEVFKDATDLAKIEQNTDNWSSLELPNMRMQKPKFGLYCSVKCFGLYNKNLFE